MIQKYRLYDIYTIPVLIVACDKLVDVKVHCRLRRMETNGVWCPILYQWSDFIGQYSPVVWPF